MGTLLESVEHAGIGRGTSGIGVLGPTSQVGDVGVDAHRSLGATGCHRIATGVYEAASGRRATSSSTRRTTARVCDRAAPVNSFNDPASAEISALSLPGPLST